MTSLENLNKSSDLPKELQLKETVFTLHDGKLIVVPQNDQISIRSSVGDHCISSEDGGEFNKRDKDEVYIEIFRENSVFSDLSINEDILIRNISSAYEVFWKGNFEDCLERRNCPKCDRTFLTPYQLFHHLENSHSILSPEVCFVCEKVFINGRTEHIRNTHHISFPDFTCEVCYQVFLNESEKNLHRLQHALTEKCKWCSVSFPCRFLLREHLLQCLNHKKHHNCVICGCRFTSSHILQLHSLRHNRYTCVLCSEKFCEDSNTQGDYHEITLVKHMKNVHSSQEIENILRGLKNQDEEEEILDKLFMTQIQSNISELKNTSTISASVPSDRNGMEKSNSSPNKDIQDLNNKKKIISLDTIFQCSECSKNFDSKKKLMVHALDHQTPFSCDICKMTFQHRRGFKKHMRCHGIRVKPELIRYKCMQCSVNCSTLSGLRTHILTHTEHKPHLCDKCGLTFRRLQALKMHEVTVHNAKTTHVCPQCGSSSTSKKSLLRHIQCLHAGVRRFICGLCSARFLQNQDLRRHLKSVHKLDFPPLQCLFKKSNSQIHVIPSAESLNPTDPLAAMLKSAVREEELKLKVFSNQEKISTSYCKSQTHLLGPETSTDGLSLNILGDVASKAVPLKQIKPCPSDTFQQSCNAKLQENAIFICEGCHYESKNLSEFSSHLSVCQQSEPHPTATEPKSTGAVSSAKPTIMYSMGSLQGSATPYNFCVFSSQNALPPTDSGVPSINSDGFVCSILPGLHVGSNLSLSTPLNVPNLGNTFICSGGESTSNITVCSDNQYSEGESILLSQNDSTRILNILSVGSFDQPQLDFLSPSISTLQEEYVPKEDKNETAHYLNHSVGSLLMDTYHSSGDLETGVIIKDSNTKLSFQSGVKKSTLSPTILDSNQLIPSEETIEVPNKDLGNLLGHVQSIQSVPLCEPTSIFVHKILQNRQTTEQGATEESDKDNKNSEEAPVNIFLNNVPTAQKPEIELEESNTTGTLQSYEILPGQNSSGEQDKNIKTSHSEYLNTDSITCSECGKKLSSASNFKRHLQVHFGGKPHECLYCGKSFRYKCNLTVHVRSHTGDRPYECTVCSKKFRYQTEFKEHKQIHETSKLFSCLDCGQRFARQRDLKRHSLSHSGKNKQTCPICQKTFSRIDYLNIHLRSHKKLEEMETVKEKCSSQSKKKARENKIIEKSCKDNLKHNENSGRKIIDPRSCSKSTSKHCPDKVGFGSVLNNSEDLISLAFQAAEDGVEFMFVEDNTLPLKENNIDAQISSVKKNVTHIKVLE